MDVDVPVGGFQQTIDTIIVIMLTTWRIVCSNKKDVNVAVNIHIDNQFFKSEKHRIMTIISIALLPFILLP